MKKIFTPLLLLGTIVATVPLVSAAPSCTDTGSLIFTSTSVFEQEINGATACTGYDQINLTGTVDLGGADLNIVKSATYTPAVGTVFTIIDNDGTDAVTGTLEGLAEGDNVTDEDVIYEISYIGGDGNDVTLEVLSVAGQGASNDTETPTEPDTGLADLATSPILLMAALASLGTSLALAKQHS